MHHVRVIQRRQVGIALGLGAALISGVSVWVNAMAVKAFGDPVLYTTVKNVIAAVLLVTIALTLTARRSPEGFIRPRGPRQLLGLATVGLFGGAVAFVLFFQGLALTSPASAGFIQKTLVIWVAILAVSFLRERFGLAHAAAIAVLVVGQIVAGGGLAMPALTTGEALVFIATLIWAVEVVIAKRLLEGLSPLTVASARMGLGGIALIVFSVASGHAAALGALTSTQWAWVALTGVILTAYVATWLSALARAQATDVTAVLAFGAIITAALSSGGQLTALAPAALGLGLIALATIAFVALALRTQSAPQRT